MVCKFTGNWCNDPQLMQCQLMLNCYNYALNECLQVGIFPDKAAESKFYVCLDDSNGGFIKLDFSCLENEYFDEETSQCLSTTLTQSESPSLTTTEELSTTSTTSETSITTETEPITELSPNTASSTESSFPITSTEFSSTTLISTELPLTSSTQSSDATSVTAASTASTPTPAFLCAAPGIFPDPLNCKGYFRCSTSLKKFYYICPGVSYFNENILKCSTIVTPACQKQILKNSTSPLTTATTQATFVATTSATAETATKTPTTKLTPSMTATTHVATTTSTTLKPFSCQIAGVFSNPADCKTYFRCTASGNKFILTCPGDTYFNGITKTCSLSISPECKKLLSN